MLDWKRLLNTERRRSSRRADGEHREEFQRDYDRALFSAAVRRLQDKAQVFPLERNDSVRTRLTHSHEVANVARSLTARAVSKLDVGDDVKAAAPLMAATSGLLHDLGNPPFGHAGEQAIQTWFEARNVLEEIKNHADGKQMTRDFLDFDGNPQTLRIVCRLQVLADEHGLNLTYGTLSAARKYVSASHEVTKARADRKKVGYFYSESDRIREIEHATGFSGTRNPIAVLVEAADDIVYSTVDLEDGITKWTLTWEQFQDTILKDDDEAGALILDKVEEILKGSDFFDLLDEHHRDNVRSQVFRTQAITRLISEAEQVFCDKYEQIMSGTFEQSLLDIIPSHKFLNNLKTINRTRVYRYAPILKLEVRGRHVIHDIMDVFWEAAKHANADGPRDKRGFSGRVWDLMSPSFRLVFKRAFSSANGNKALEDYARLQLVCDNVSGMTDTYACDLRRELYGD